MSFLLLPSPSRDGIMATARFVIGKVFFLLVTFPAVTCFLICSIVSGLSFNDLSRSLVDVQYESQQLGPASQPDRLRTSRCADPAPSISESPPQVVSCANETITEVPVTQLSREFASTLRTNYWLLVLIGLFSMVCLESGRSVIQRYSKARNSISV